MPHAGQRSLTRNDDGLVDSEVYTDYPTPYVLRRFDGGGTKVALTFDDGPDARFTPRVLRVLLHSRCQLAPALLRLPLPPLPVRPRSI